MSALGWHSLIELTGCPAERLARVDAVRPLLLEAVRRAGGTIVTDVFHPFSPQGVSGVVVIAESHVTIHTWPEHGYAAVDVFSCNPALDHEALRRALAEGLGAQGSDVRGFARGP